MSNLFHTATAVVAAFLGVVACYFARHRVEHLRQTGETFAQRNVSSSCIVSIVVVLAVTGASVLVAHNVGLSVALIGLVVAIVGCAYLAIIDIDTHLLPWSDSIVVGIASCSFLLVDAALRSQNDVIAVMIASGVITWCVFRFIEWMSRGDLGGGDVVLASVLAAVLGWFGVGAVMNALVYAIVCAGVFALGAVVLSGFRARTAFAFGPFLITGAVIVMITAHPLWTTTY